MICIRDLRFLLKIFQSNANFFKGKSYFKSPLSPRAFDHGPGPGPGLSPSPNVGPRALQKPRAPGRARAWALTHH